MIVVKKMKSINERLTKNRSFARKMVLKILKNVLKRITNRFGRMIEIRFKNEL